MCRCSGCVGLLVVLGLFVFAVDFGLGVVGWLCLIGVGLGVLGGFKA